ncbi:MAG: OstA-like protein [Bacteroidales bacterium]|nr:OstA-like protein [Bacteroidales bacterium]NLM92720.1 organic solvent tolerance protein OstA [Bacteroidales bacterium]
MKHRISNDLTGRFILLTVFLCLSGFSALAQEKTPIGFSARSMQFDKRIGEDARRLIDNVHFSHEGTNMYCDSAYLFSQQNRLQAYRNIYIQVNDTVSIFGDRLDYDGNTRIAELTGNVKMIDPQMTLTTGHLIYDLNNSTANYAGGGRIVDKENTLTSRWGYYYVNQKQFFFKDDVKLVNPEYVMDSDTLRYNTLTEVAYFLGPTTIVSDENTIFCRNGWYDTRNDVSRFSKDAFLNNKEQSITGDSLFYDRRQGYGRADRNIVIRDTVQNSIITGHFAEHYEREGISVVTREAMLTVISEGDSLFMHADTLRAVYLDESEEQFVFAYHKAKFFRHDLQGLSDSIVYNFSDSTIYLFYNPIIWSDVHQLTAERMEIQTAENEILAAHLFDASFIISEEMDVGFNQVKGRNITGHFSENELRRIDVFGNGETIYFVKEDDGAIVGINKAISSNIIIYIEGQEVTGIRFLENPEANLYPMDELPEADRRLRNFKWHQEKRPKKKEDIFIRE